MRMKLPGKAQNIYRYRWLRDLQLHLSLEQVPEPSESVFECFKTNHELCLTKQGEKSCRLAL
jgi:hypothetical protein